MRWMTVTAWLVVATTPLAGQQVRVTSSEVAPGVYMIVGQGGNIGVSSGPDGVFLIDDQFAPLTDRIVAAIRELSDAPIRFVINTHWHGDHVGGNENLGRAGALIVAHDNVRARMSVEQFMEAVGQTVPARPEAALPVVTFSAAVTFHLNGDELHVLHVPRAHTDGDALIHFRRANVVHMGDTFFAGRYPFIDWGSGGTIHGVITAADTILALADDATRIIPGHGALSSRADLLAYRAMLAAARDRVRDAVARGMTLEQVKQARLMREFDDEWGSGYVNTDRFIEAVYRTIGEGR